MQRESPEYVRISLAAAMVLGFKNGLFYRNAHSPCINILLTYNSGCAGKCAYCGLSMKRPGKYLEKSFIRVAWHIYKLTDIMKRIHKNIERIKRVCISMITNKRSKKDTIEITKDLRKNFDIPVSLLVCPTILIKEDFYRFKENGADIIGIAVDTATSSLFENLRGRGVCGPHKWEKYWQSLEEAVSVFGKGKVGVHLIVGLGEKEQEMVKTIQHAHNIGIRIHLFSFFPEEDSALSSHLPPPIGQYRRIQLARYLINENLATINDLTFDNCGRLVNFGLSSEKLVGIIESGKAFMTSGCPDKDGNLACNRPYADSLPGPDIRNFPFIPEKMDIQKIKKELWQ